MNIMASIRGYKYNTLAAAEAAQKQCDDFYGLPKEDGTTLNWIGINEGNGFWYIMGDDSIADILGATEQIEIVDQ
jgi:hypothetical protein